MGSRTAGLEDKVDELERQSTAKTNINNILANNFPNIDLKMSNQALKESGTQNK